MTDRNNTKQVRTILGVDPGSRRAGFGVLIHDGSRLDSIEWGVIRPKLNQTLPERLSRVHADLSALVRTHHPDVMAVESVFYAANVKSALTLGHVRGVILLAASQAGIPVFEYSPLEVKLAVTGYGRAEKGQVAAMVKTLLRLDPCSLPQDSTDALAVAICHAHSHGPAVDQAMDTGTRKRSVKQL